MAGDNPTPETQKGEHAKGEHPKEAAPLHGRSVLGAVFNAVMRGGELQAMGRMGVDELSQALKAFPDSIHAHAEPGGMFEPLHSDIAAARDQYAPRESLPSPGDIAKGQNFTAAERQDGDVHGRGDVQTAQVDKPVLGPWTKMEKDRREGGNGGNDQNDQGRGRSLPDEQREQDKGQGR